MVNETDIYSGLDKVKSDFGSYVIQRDDEKKVLNTKIDLLNKEIADLKAQIPAPTPTPVPTPVPTPTPGANDHTYRPALPAGYSKLYETEFTDLTGWGWQSATPTYVTIDPKYGGSVKFVATTATCEIWRKLGSAKPGETYRMEMVCAAGPDGTQHSTNNGFGMGFDLRIGDQVGTLNAQATTVADEVVYLINEFTIPSRNTQNGETPQPNGFWDIIRLKDMVSIKSTSGTNKGSKWGRGSPAKALEYLNKDYPSDGSMTIHPWIEIWHKNTLKEAWAVWFRVSKKA